MLLCEQSPTRKFQHGTHYLGVLGHPQTQSRIYTVRCRTSVHFVDRPQCYQLGLFVRLPIDSV